jgi:hypothetical protein
MRLRLPKSDFYAGLMFSSLDGASARKLRLGRKDALLALLIVLFFFYYYCHYYYQFYVFFAPKEQFYYQISAL